MFHHLHAGDLERSGSRTTRFEGAPYSAGISMFLVDADPGRGADLHRHPYPETFVVRAGRARFTVGEETVEAGAGDVVVVEAGTPHGFKNPGPGPLEMVTIHAAERMETDWLGVEL